MSQQDPGGRPPTEEELRAAYEQQLKQLRVEDVIVQTVVSLINLAGRKAGLAPGTEDEADREQLRLAIESVRALLPLVEEQLGPDGAAVRDALSQLQLAYTRMPAAVGPAGGPHEDPAGGETPPQDTPQGPGPAQSSGRLWVPGQ
jgi:hypothetical protein